MKQFWLVFVILFFNVQVNANTWVNGDVCDELLRDYLSQTVVVDGEEKSIFETSVREWAPARGSIYIINNKRIYITFRFDEESINILGSREDMALEIDFVNFLNLSSLFIIPKDWTFTHNFPREMQVQKDTSFLDPLSSRQISIMAIGTHHLKADKDYVVNIELNNPITQIGDLKLNIDLSVNFAGVDGCPNTFYNETNSYSPFNYFTLEIEQYARWEYNPSDPIGIRWINKTPSGWDKHQIPDHVGEMGILGYDNTIYSPAYINYYNNINLHGGNGEDIFGYPVSNDSKGELVHYWPDNYSDPNSLSVQDYSKDNHWWQLVYNEIEEQVFSIHGKILEFWHNNYGYRDYGAPYTDEIKHKYANNPFVFEDDYIQPGDDPTVQKFEKEDVGSIDPVRKTIVYNPRNDITENFPISEYEKKSPIGVQWYASKNADLSEATPWPQDGVTAPTGRWFTKAVSGDDRYYFFYYVNGVPTEGTPVFLNEGNSQVFGNSISTSICSEVVNGLPTGKTSIFRSSDEYVGFFYKLTEIYDSLSIDVKWYRPDGTMYGECKHITDYPTNTYWQEFYKSQFLNISDLTDYGMWKVELHVNNIKIDTQYFNISSEESGSSPDPDVEADAPPCNTILSAPTGFLVIP